MSEERKLFSQADEFDFKRKFVIAFMAGLRPSDLANPSGYVEAAYELADKWWAALVEHGVNDTSQ